MQPAVVKQCLLPGVYCETFVLALSCNQQRLLVAVIRSFAEQSPAVRSPPLDKQYDSAKASAAASLSYRPHSRAELKHKLRDKGFDTALASRALDRLEELVLPSPTGHTVARGVY